MARRKYIPEQLRRLIHDRAEGRCEYCLIHEDDMLFPHEPDHIIAEKHQGQAIATNLAWSCYHCNRNKGTDIASIDPQTGKGELLFNPRTQQWKRHFRLNGPLIEPLTASGRATAALLQFNDADRVERRLGLMAIGHYPRR
jgi:hypothetical protein